MARDLKKFVNPKFVRTCDLKLVRRLLARHSRQLKDFDVNVLNRESEEARTALGNLLAGDESNYPSSLKADLHLIADLGNSQGKRLLIERARAAGVILRPMGKADKEWKPDPKQLALLCFLDHRPIFDSASDLLAIETTATLTEYRGIVPDTRTTLDEKTKEAFEGAVRRLLSTELQGLYCRVGWYADDDDINIVVVHGLDFTTELVIEAGQEKVISFQPAGTAVLSYNASDGRLKVGGINKAQRSRFAEMFAGTILAQPGFFAGEDAQNLYTLTPVEQAGFGSAFEHQFDAGVRSVRIIEVQVEKVLAPGSKRRPGPGWSILLKDGSNALERLGQESAVTFPAYRLQHLGFRIEFERGAEDRRAPTVAVKLAPPRSLQFKRYSHEGRILELLRRNGLTVERKPYQATVATE